MITKLNLTDIKIRNILVQHIGILIVGVLIFLIEKLEIASPLIEKVTLVVVSLAKSVYFIEHSFKKIEEASLNNISYNKFLGIILMNILLIVVSFSTDYVCLVKIDPHSFRGFGEGYWNIIYDSFYFSLTSFTTVAYGDILPITKSAKSIIILEVVVAYVTTIIIISNFVQIKDSMEQAQPPKEKEKETVQEEEHDLTPRM
jgi:hypothetical protein